MPIKLIACDIDGTLLDSGGKLPERHAAAIEAAKAKGLLFTLSTGRPLIGAAPYLHLVSPGVPVICENGGALVIDEPRRYMLRKQLSAEATVEAAQRGDKLGARVSVWLDDVLYYNHEDGYRDKYIELGAEILPLDISNIGERFPGGSDKVVWLGEPELLDRLTLELAERPLKSCVGVRSMSFLMEFMSEGISKAYALHRLAEELGLKQAEIMAVGDGMNDLEMLQAAGLGVAMGNAPELLRSAADFVVPSSDEGGLADAIALALPL